jgi:SAM-dependent methyltransferase
MPGASDVSRSAYDRWLVFYDQEPNPIVAVDEAHFPGIWRRLSGQRVLEIGCGTGRHTTLKLARQGNEVVGIAPLARARVERRRRRSPLLRAAEVVDDPVDRARPIRPDQRYGRHR